jgi:putative heme-binding domain-containing protein
MNACRAVFVVGVAAVGLLASASSAAPPAFTKEQQRGFAMSHAGDAARGKVLFGDAQRLACARCHATDGKTASVGPDLATIGDKFGRTELIDAILSPSAQIAIGYSTTIITTRDGDVMDGIIKDASDSQITLVGVDAESKHVNTSDIADRRVSAISMMPEGLQNGLTREEFADLIEYLVSLKLPQSLEAARQGMPASIRHTAVPITLLPLHSDEHRFNHPDWIGQIPGDKDAFLICEHETGKVWLLEKRAGGETKALFADFASEIRRGGATGLLGLALHPKFRENHKYYLQHERMVEGTLCALVSQRVASDDFKRDAGTPSRTIMQLACTTDVHAGGGIAFGPDGFLYVAMGDTGPQGDPQGHGQDLSLPLGKMLRIDVDHAENGKPYAIPADNPFRSTPGARPEIWAYGFREPWRFSFDPLNGDLWVGDVGQDRIEEVDLVRRGENYGWNVYEGFEPFSVKRRRDGEKYVPPLFAYTRRLGNSITGGYVYRGDPRSPFYGVYVCADYTSKRIWGITQRDRNATAIRQIATCPESVASLGTDEAGNLYVVGYQGTVYRMDFAGATFDEGPASRQD